MNGMAHAGRRNEGCDCARCAAINPSPARPPRTLTDFPGWPDPAERAHSSLSLLVPDEADPSRVGTHILIDVGGGVVDSLVDSRIPGIERVDALVLSHWHSDHIQGHEALRDVRRTQEGASQTIPFHCHPESYAKVLAENEGIADHLEYHPSDNGVPFRIGTFEFVPFQVRHLDYPGCLVHVCTEERTGIKMIFAWDIDTPDCVLPGGIGTNLDVFTQDIFADASSLIVESNTWQTTRFVLDGERRTTGHANFLAGWQYVQTCRPKGLGITHLSGHEDELAPDQMGFGWPDARWVREARAYSDAHPVGGRSVPVHELYQGTVFSSDVLPAPG